jgi:two-component system, chemotaxis family, chemotaxis protein CheY
MPLYITPRGKGGIVLNSIKDKIGDDVLSNTGSRLCLIADDSAVVRKIARKMLTGMGFEIDEAENGKRALETCEHRMPDVILLDWNMPIMDGLEFLISLRRCDGGKVPNVIFCTTETDAEHIRSAIEAGADQYLMKPFDTESLGTAVAGITYRQ